MINRTNQVLYTINDNNQIHPKTKNKIDFKSESRKNNIDFKSKFQKINYNLKFVKLNFFSLL